ncbi:extracellular solute-binding protein [Streptomyces violaceoruber]|uniref:Binding protein dependent transport lipoprotein n=1 Tax=Streptomyces coelicolor (strain ATCC BAA-471 / A3(2) / M145) TaxID=100226 RepID=Q93JA7_STRCO|nr:MULTISPECIES: extracellular solute-binding protein [Streptomyces]MBQ0948749.1 extracellular solute-binding protein [Streptomyces sp. RK76]MCW8122872.1 extracellular solute-binding protein [Streptomyces anthocyanicus]MDX2924444.1 extracellular solute-binding protein [Streptomyces sp. NRRL_B-16638]MDX3344143.1 extracellular solute-binding protein [Streptomyces sp. ME02-6979A]MDX3366671.1 extracellular solute-binding protein [Streptomyces sp. ME02-6987-2C]
MRIRTLRSRTIAVGVTAALGIGLLSGCASSTGPGRPDREITVWSQENLPDRVAATQKVIDGFEKKTGVKVKLVGVDEKQMPQLIMSAAASGTLPDVIGAAPMGQVWQMYSNGLLNTDIPKRIVDGLGRDTFNANALELTSDGGTSLGVPSDAWLQLLVYRKDQFGQRSLPAPTTYAKALAAAKALTTEGHDGISAATDPSDAFTSQSFESLALANDCQLVDDRHEVALDSPRCQEAFRTYDRLARTYGAPGTQTVDSTRATYFAGRSSMVIWSSFLLDELAGLRKDALPSCPQCAKDPRYLSDHSGIVTAMQGPDADEAAQFGEITSWVTTKTAETAASREFIEYMMGTGYESWFGMAPEGKIPVRKGTAAEPERYLDAWRHSDIGVDTRKPLDEVFPTSLLDQLADGVSNMRRWGITQGEGALVGATNGELPVPKAIGAMTSGQSSPSEAARDADEEVAALRKSLQ